MRVEKDSQEFSVYSLDERVLLGVMAVLLLSGLFLPELLGESPLVFPLKLAVLAAGIGIVFLLWQQLAQTEEGEPEDEDIDRSLESSVRSFGVDEGQSASSSDGRNFNFQEELTQFFDNLVKIVRSSLVAHSAIVLLWNKHHNTLQVEFCDSESDSMKSGNRIGINGTLPGSVLLNKTAILEQNIPSGQPVNYYQKPVEIRSFLGVPMHIHGDVRGVLVVDSLIANDFSEKDLALLKSYENLISQGVEMVSEREKSRLIGQSIAAQRTFLSNLNEDFSKDSAFAALGKASRQVFDFHRITIILVDELDPDYGIVAKVFGQEDSMRAGFRFRLDDGLSGWIVRRSKSLLLGDLEKGDLFRPRYSKDDKSNFGLRSFVGVPITIDNRVLGSITMEHRQPDYYTEWDQSILSVLADNMGLAIRALKASQVSSN